MIDVSVGQKREIDGRRIEGEVAIIERLDRFGALKQGRNRRQSDAPRFEPDSRIR